MRGVRVTINKSMSNAGEQSIMRMLLLALALCALLTAVVLPASARQPATTSPRDERDEAELYQALLDLTNPWTVMCIAAHPDDEDGATLTVLRRKYGAHTVTLFSTYGEGGQNAVGPELYEELGAIRERETREASAIQGSEPHFLGLRDFGYSKSADEAFRVWGQTAALSSMVLQIRRLRPDVIITNHDTTSGHGHHQATGRLVQEAFDAAADPARFPEQLGTGGVRIWQAQRLFVRVRSASAAATASKTPADEASRAGALVSIDPNERDTVRGATYAEQALRALQRHASQGPWPQTVPAGGMPVIRYRLVRSSKQAAPLPSNASSVLEGMSLPEKASSRLAPLAASSLLALYSGGATQRTRLLDALIAARHGGLFENLTDDRPRLLLMTERLDHALAVASGVSIKFEPHGEPLIPGTPATFHLALSNRGGAEITAQSISFKGGGQEAATSLLKEPARVAPGKTFVVTAKDDHTNRLSLNVPRSEHLYDGRVSGEQFRADAVIKLNGAQFPVAAQTNVDVAPAVEITSLSPSPFVVTPSIVKSNHTESNQIVTFSLRLINHQDTPFEGEVIAGKPDGKDFSRDRTVTLPAQGSLDMKVSVARSFITMAVEQGVTRPIPNIISFSVRRANSSAPITERRVRVVWADAQVDPHLRVGYIRSFDDTLRDALAALGVESKELTVDDVRAGKLQGYDTIIIDNRGYQAHPELINANSRLLEYVQAGGTLVVFYHKTDEWNPDAKAARPQLAPYPITLGNERITDENAAVAFLEPQHQLLNFPNKLTPDDFKGWIQERGLYYPKQWDTRYSAPLASSDAGEQPLRGGLLAADYGRGRYVYTSMVWYRQLRAGVPGAYRMLANMLSYGHANRSATNAGVR
jgi:LmbE family N-acetylglucosaminyl deacetylase